jgi:hypothetical protein
MAERIIGYLVADDEETAGLGDIVADVVAKTGRRIRLVPSDFSRFDDVVTRLVPDHVPSPAWMLQARRNADSRVRFLAEFGGLDAEDVADFAQSTARNRRATAYRWRDDGLIFGVGHAGKTVYPAFQFDPDTHRPKPVVGGVLAQLPPGLRHGGWQLALWWDTPLDVLDWQRPVDVMDTDADAAINAARAEAADWADASGN